MALRVGAIGLCKLTRVAPDSQVKVQGFQLRFVHSYEDIGSSRSGVPLSLIKLGVMKMGFGTCECTEAVPYSTASVHPHMSRKERTHKFDKIIRITRQNSTIRDIRYLVVKNKSIIIAPSIHTHIHIVLYSVFGKLLSYNKGLIYSSTQLCHSGHIHSTIVLRCERKRIRIEVHLRYHAMYGPWKKSDL